MYLPNPSADPFNEGYECQRYGALREDNPYDPDMQPQVFDAWDDGWIEAREIDG